MAPRDIPPGATYSEAIIDGITQARALVLILSENANLSRHVLAEVERAFSMSKPVFPVRIRDVQPVRGLELFVSGSQWIDALTLPLDSKMNDLASALHNLESAISVSAPRAEEIGFVSEKKKELNNRLRNMDVLDVACRLVDTGETGLEYAPVQTFGRMMTADPAVTEQATAIHARLKHHFETRARCSVLNIAAFGPLGSGKRFSINEVVRSSGVAQVVPIDVELARLHDPKELVPAYRNAQDAALRGRTPVLYLEGIDLPLAGIPFGWLQHFGHEMRDGEFADEGVYRPLGSSVLCFVGTRLPSHSHMTQEMRSRGHSQPPPEFLSMVDCFFDIAGINPLWPEDCVYMLNRALCLRALLGLRRRTIDRALRRALLTAPRYYYDVRSLDAIIEACRPTGQGQLTAESLPADEELNQHTDAQLLRNALRSGT